MKYIFILFFLIFTSCINSKQTYMCGDLPCGDKKEFKEYFAKNLTVEIKVKKSKKNTSFDLVKSNTLGSTENLKRENSSYQAEKLNKKEEKIKLKAQKTRLKNERKIKKNELKNQAKIEKKLAKLKKSLKKEEEDNNYIPKIFKKEKSVAKTTNSLSGSTNKTKEKNNQTESFQVIRSDIQLSVCENIKNCDIDKIAELLIKKGKEKDFPIINSN